MHILMPSVLATAVTPAAGASEAPPAWVNMVPFILMAVMMYMVLWRPQQKRIKDHQTLIDQLKVGDKVITGGGIHGAITAVKDKSFMVKIADSVVIEISRGGVATVLGKESEDTK